MYAPDGLLRRRGVTAVLCTHSVRYLSFADHIVAIGEDGCIVEQGTFQNLMANRINIHSLGIKSTGGLRSTDATVHVEAARSPSPVAGRTSTLLPIAPCPKGEKERKMGDPTVYRYYLASLGKTSVIAFLGFGFGWGLFYNWGTIWLKYWSKDITSAHPARSNGFYIGLLVYFRSLIFFPSSSAT